MSAYGCLKIRTGGIVGGRGHFQRVVQGDRVVPTGQRDGYTVFFGNLPLRRIWTSFVVIVYYIVVAYQLFFFFLTIANELSRSCMSLVRYTLKDK